MISEIPFLFFNLNNVARICQWRCIQLGLHWNSCLQLCRKSSTFVLQGRCRKETTDLFLFWSKGECCLHLERGTDIFYWVIKIFKHHTIAKKVESGSDSHRKFISWLEKKCDNLDVYLFKIPEVVGISSNEEIRWRSTTNLAKEIGHRSEVARACWALDSWRG